MKYNILKYLLLFLKKIWVGEKCPWRSLSQQLLGYSPILVYHCAALCKMYSFNHILSNFTRFMVFFILICQKKGVRSSPPAHRMYVPLSWLNKLLKALINSFVVISDETYIFLNNNLDWLKKIKGVENALNKSHAVQLQGGSASNMDKYSHSSPVL